MAPLTLHPFWLTPRMTWDVAGIAGMRRAHATDVQPGRHTLGGQTKHWQPSDVSDACRRRALEKLQQSLFCPCADCREFYGPASREEQLWIAVNAELGSVATENCQFPIRSVVAATIVRIGAVMHRATCEPCVSDSLSVITVNG